MVMNWIDERHALSLVASAAARVWNAPIDALNFSTVSIFTCKHA